MRPDPADLELVGAAVSALRKGRGPELHPAAAAVRTRTGRVVTGLGVGGCPELVAVGAALALGEKVVTLVTVRHVDADATRVCDPCPACRTLLRRHAPGVRVVHLAGGLQVSPVESLG